jgi:hypothetical protein
MEYLDLPAARLILKKMQVLTDALSWVLDAIVPV